MQVVAILLGAILCGGTSLCLGIYFLRRLLSQMERTEYFALAFLVGSACFSQLVFFLCAVGLARKGVFLAIGLVAPAVAIRSIRRMGAGRQSSRLPSPWKWLLGSLFVVF